MLYSFLLNSSYKSSKNKKTKKNTQTKQICKNILKAKGLKLTAIMNFNIGSVNAIFLLIYQLHDWLKLDKIYFRVTVL